MSKLLAMYESHDQFELGYPGGPAEELFCDVVVVGGGGSGLSAAVRAAQLGAKVILVEKLEDFGGNSNLAGGLLATNSSFHQAEGFPDKTEEFIKTNLHKHGYTLNGDLLRRYIGNAGKFYDHLAELGFDTDNIRYIMDAVVTLKKRLDPGPLKHPSFGPGNTGTAIVELFKKHLEPMGIHALTKTKVKKLLRDERGLCGVLADGQEKSYQINAKAVILSTGGFGANPELLRRFIPLHFTSDNYISHYCLSSTTGEGITMAEEIGAEVGKNISVGLNAMDHVPGTYSMQLLSQCKGSIIVNGYGKRFVAEDDTRGAALVMDMQPQGIGYLLFTDGCKERLFEEVLKEVWFEDRVPTWEEFLNDIRQEITEGKILYGETISDLAREIGCDPKTLEATIEEYESFCEKQHDDVFYKSPEHLKTMGSGPWYALKLYRKFDVTMGGVSVNVNIQAITPEGDPIPGLYVTGDAASGWMGTEYGPLFSSFCWAMNSGYLAAEEAVKAIK